MMKILVTGGSGFIGKNLIYLLREKREFEVFGATVEETMDLTNPCSVQSVLEKTKPDFIVHLAALTFVPNNNPITFYLVNTIGTENLLRSIVDLNVAKLGVLCFSTAGIYGIQETKLLSESLTPKPVNHYSMSKHCMEHIVNKYRCFRGITVVRPFNVLGLGQNINFLVPKMVSAFVKKDKTIELGNLDSVRDFISVNDCCDIIYRLISKLIENETINICTGIGYSVYQIFQLLCEISMHQMEIKQNELFVRHDDIPQMIGDPSKLLNVLGNDYRFTSVRAILEEMYKNRLLELSI
ncbi:epimerase [Aggregatibacter actinomycetemcomitans]|nr:GDP-mannose 4,6-dehydratase [Aggregatibacter actinomycetemcomitans]AFI87065.2 epimerase [Aggregatibacter actinomycetemcomitans D7S-1]EKX97197.1 NAD dependent epimerase/dehydratase family protein [Aggregatibacter actinomycetemcomitans Y4]KND82587.1 epimerase [Aggregatibacter actinomycetemcomitans serotype a str. H5P1]KOE31694.1 epimerase [Aggregatibacter actinomycetemcomitans D17P-3]AMQ94173.1 epimerase [Aggregatibacter actinomycetemcomitans]